MFDNPTYMFDNPADSHMNTEVSSTLSFAREGKNTANFN